MKKYLSELIGTFTLVFIGCGTAMTVGCDSFSGSGYIITAFAFGLAIVAMAYSIGNISGCHVNPAVSLAVYINKGISAKDLVGYTVAQILGALAGSGVLALIYKVSALTDMTGGYGSNGLNGVNGSIVAGLIVEVVLTCIFVLAILGVTDSKLGHGSFGGLVIGLSLVLVHLIGIGLTGTSVNPARSLGPAIMAAISGNTSPITEVWIFVVGPLVGGVLAAFIWKCLTADTIIRQAKPKAEKASKKPSAKDDIEISELELD